MWRRGALISTVGLGYFTNTMNNQGKTWMCSDGQQHMGSNTCSAEKLNCFCELIFQCLVLSTTTRLFATIKEATCSHQLTTKRCYNDAISRAIDQTSDWVFSVLGSVTVTPRYTSAQVTDNLSFIYPSFPHPLFESQNKDKLSDGQSAPES